MNEPVATIERAKEMRLEMAFGISGLGQQQPQGGLNSTGDSNGLIQQLLAEMLQKQQLQGLSGSLNTGLGGGMAGGGCCSSGGGCGCGCCGQGAQAASGARSLLG